MKPRLSRQKLIYVIEMKELGTGLRHDMKELEIGLRYEIGDLRKDMDTRLEKTTSVLQQKMSDMKFELLKWLIGLVVAQAGLIIGLLKFFPINS